jgi:hypothetical protein
MVVHSRFQYISLSTQQWLLLAPDRPCAQHVQSTRRMSLTVKRPSTKGLPFQLVMSPATNHVCSTARLAARPHALRTCARQPRGCHFNWLWPFVMLRATPQLSSALPRRRSGCVESMGNRLRRIPARTRTRSGACMLDTYMRTAPTLILLDGGPSQDTWAALWSDEAIKARRRPPRDPASRHPCRKEASFLPCTGPPDFVASRCSSTVFATRPVSSRPVL